MRKVLVLLGCAFALAACGADDSQASQTPISRNFAALADAVAGCVDVLHDCDDQDDAGARGAAACKTQFLDCRKSAGKPSENDLAEAVGACQDRQADCKADAGDDKGRDACSQGLRACIGEARASKDDAARDAAAPNANPPTYQCFGQLRECVTDGESPSKCAAAARSCIIAAVGDRPEWIRPSAMQPPAAGMSAGGKGGANAAGMGGAGAGGAAGAKPNDPLRAGAGGSKPADPPAGDPDECAKKQVDCVMSGEKPMTCMRKQRMCEKGMDDQ